MNRHPHSSSATRNIPQLMDHPISSSPIQQQQQYDQVRTTKTSTVRSMAPSNNQTSSTPRRPLDESGSSEKKPHRQVKRSRPYEPTPSTHPSAFTSSFPTGQFRFPQYHLKHAVSNNLPCFYIKFNDNTGQFQIPSLMNV